MTKAMNGVKPELPAINFGQECHPGLKREDNQDNVAHAMTPRGELFVIADGVGGYYGGAEASKVVVEGYPRHLAALPLTMSAEAALLEATKRVNAEVFAAGQSGDASRRRMSSTVVLALIVQNGLVPEAVIGNIGDSRAYLVRGGLMSQVSTNHTVVQGMLDAGVLTPQQAKFHPHSGVLTRTLGQAPDVVLDVKRVPLQPGDQILLCSDGLHGYANESEIQAVMLSPQLSPAASARALLDLALASGGPDNISVQVLRISAFSGGRFIPAPGSRTRSRTLPLAVGTAAGVLLASLAGVKYYQTLQSKPVTPVASVQTPVPTISAGAGQQTQQLPAGGQQNGSLKVGQLPPLNDPDKAQFLRYKEQTNFTDVDPKHQVSCARFAQDQPIAYYADDSVLKEAPADSKEFRAYFSFKKQSSQDIKTACGSFDLLLLPSKRALQPQAHPAATTPPRQGSHPSTKGEQAGSPATIPPASPAPAQPGSPAPTQPASPANDSLQVKIENKGKQAEKSVSDILKKTGVGKQDDPK